jgi:hypothetical protein
LLPLAILLASGLLAGAAGYFLDKDGAATPSAPSPVASTFVTGVVQEVTPANLTLSVDGTTRTFSLSERSTAEMLQATTLIAIRAGDWLNAGAIQHAQTLFALTGIVVIPQSNLESP